MKMIIRWYIGVTGYGRSTVSAGSKEQVPRVFSPMFTAEVQLLRVRRRRQRVKFSYHGLRQSSSYCGFNMWSYGYHKLREHTGWWALVWKEETEPVVLRVTSAQRAQLRMRLYLYVLSKVATSNQMTENKTNDAQQRRVRPSKRGITTARRQWNRSTDKKKSLGQASDTSSKDSECRSTDCKKSRQWA